MKRVKTCLLAALLFTVILLIYPGCADKAGDWQQIEIRGRTMGTFYMVKVIVPVEKEPESVKRKLSVGIETVLDQVNRQMSAWLGDSEISRFNRYTGNDWFEVSADTALVVNEALRMSALSGGSFDVTIGPLIDLWGFGPSHKNGPEPVVPDDEDIQNTMKKTGYQKLTVQLSPPALKKEIPGLECNLSAIAKGFGVDKVAEYLRNEGYTDFLVEIGGEVRTYGKNVKRQSWLIGIASPDGSANFQRIVELNNTAMATSGDYHNYFEKDNVRYSHTIEPTTGKPITHKLASVTVIAPSCMLADGMATAINVMGPEKGFDLAVKEDLSVFMIIKSDQGFVEKMTPRFKELLQSQGLSQ